MKSKQVAAGMVSAAVCLSLLTACGQNESVQNEASVTKESTMHTLYIRDAGKSTEMTASFLNTMNGKREDIAMTKTGEDADSFTYTCEADTAAYNMVHVVYNEGSSMDVAFNAFVSGWYLENDELLPYTEGSKPSYQPVYETKTFPFNDNDTDVYIWTPSDYDAKAEEKYSVIYMMDGQSVLDTRLAGEIQCWNVSEHVSGMIAATGNKAIIVAINTMAARDDILIPDLGELYSDEKIKAVTTQKKGGVFADFVCNTIVPYVEENYNVYTDPAHNAVCGSSYGGLESFYIGMEHPEKFGTIGALSTSFGVYGEEVWKTYLSGKTFDQNSPFVYIYAGLYYGDNGNCTEWAYDTLLDTGYPKDKLVFCKYETGKHFVPYWRNVYPEFLEAMFTGKVVALESGVPVEYEDKTVHEEMSMLENSVDENDPRSNYLYYDNSERKWEKVYAYWWGDGMTTNKITGEPYGREWPGMEMEQIDGTDIYRIVVPVGASFIIFNSGVTDDKVMDGVEAYQTEDLPYSADVHAGQLYKIDLSQEPNKGRGVEKTKYRYPGGTWSKYEG